MADKYIARSSAIAARMMGGEMMIMSAADSTFFTLNETATLIWQAADGSTPLSQIVADKLCGEYEIDPLTALGDAQRFVEELAGHGILITSDEPITSQTEGSTT